MIKFLFTSTVLSLLTIGFHKAHLTFKDKSKYKKTEKLIQLLFSECQ